MREPLDTKTRALGHRRGRRPPPPWPAPSSGSGTPRRGLGLGGRSVLPPQGTLALPPSSRGLGAIGPSSDTPPSHLPSRPGPLGPALPPRHSPAPTPVTAPPRTTPLAQPRNNPCHSPAPRRGSGRDGARGGGAARGGAGRGGGSVIPRTRAPPLRPRPRPRSTAAAARGPARYLDTGTDRRRDDNDDDDHVDSARRLKMRFQRDMTRDTKCHRRHRSEQTDDAVPPACHLLYSVPAPGGPPRPLGGAAKAKGLKEDPKGGRTGRAGRGEAPRPLSRGPGRRPCPPPGPQSPRASVPQFLGRSVTGRGVGGGTGARRCGQSRRRRRDVGPHPKAPTSSKASLSPGQARPSPSRDEGLAPLAPAPPPLNGVPITSPACCRTPVGSRREAGGGLTGGPLPAWTPRPRGKRGKGEASLHPLGLPWTKARPLARGPDVEAPGSKVRFPSFSILIPSRPDFKRGPAEGLPPSNQNGPTPTPGLQSDPTVSAAPDGRGPAPPTTSSENGRGRGTIGRGPTTM